jgi:isoamyl acetate esterase
MNRWAAALGHYWSRKVDVINRGFSGYNSRWGLTILDDAVLTLQPQLVMIFFGANDASVDQSPNHIDLEEYELNMEHMVETIQEVRH